MLLKVQYILCDLLVCGKLYITLSNITNFNKIFMPIRTRLRPQIIQIIGISLNSHELMF